MHDLPEELTGDLVLTVVVNIDGLDCDVLVVEEYPHHDDPMNRIIGNDEAIAILELVLNDVGGVTDDENIVNVVLLPILHTSTECLEAVLELDELCIDPKMGIVGNNLSWHVCSFQKSLYPRFGI